MPNVLMICHGNICRSTMAEFVLKDLVEKRGESTQFHIASAGTSTEEIGHDTHPGTRRKLTQMGVPFTPRKARQITPADYEAFDYLLCMDSANVRNALRLLGKDPEQKVRRLLDFTATPRDIADPWYTGNFDDTYADVLIGCKAFLQALAPSY